MSVNGEGYVLRDGPNLNDATINEDEEIEFLKFKRGQLEAKLTRFKLYLDTVDINNIDYIDLEARFAPIDGIIDKFDEIQGHIEILGKNYQNEQQTRITFENAYFDINKTVKRHFANKPKEVSFNINVDQVESKIKLPNLQLPSFSGQYDEWLSFRDLFDDMINKNDKLSNVQKFYYLKSCLKGEALEVIRGVAITNENYATAWDLLTEQFENTKRIISKHMKAIYDLQPVKAESAQLLKTFIHNFNKNFRALTALGQPTNYWDTPMVCLIRAKIDLISKREWDKLTKRDETRDLTVRRFIDFLNERVQLLENDNDEIKRTKEFIKPNKTLSHLVRSIMCSFCQQSHLNQDCRVFEGKTLQQRNDDVRKYKLCSNCLRPGHFAKECRTQGCKSCGRKHHYLLHKMEVGVQAHVSPPAKEERPAVTEDLPTVTSSALVKSYERAQPQHQVLLATALVIIRDDRGNKVECRALLDSGAQSNFMTSELAAKLNLKMIDTNIPLVGVNNLISHVRQRTTTRLWSRDGKYETRMTFLLIDKITDDLPQTSFDISTVNLPMDLRLADPYVNESRPIDILIGADMFFEILGTGQLKLNKGKLKLHETKLGWILAGTLESTICGTIRCNLATNLDDLYENVQSFWRLEEFTDERKYSREEAECEEHFRKTMERDCNGRFMLELPLKDEYVKLGGSEQGAVKQFYMLEKRFQRNEEFKQRYVDFLKEYQSLGHMSEVRPDCDSLKYYLPHHGVIKETSVTTKLRVVFNASAKTDSGISLNDVLKIGPVVQNDLFTIMINFRAHNVVLTADIEKMYRQCNIAPKHRSLQRIVCRFDSSETLKHYELNTLTYGTAPASFMACRCLIELAKQNEINYPEACDVIRNDFYMDDLVTGGETVEQVIRLKEEVSDILKTAGFILRKWNSNEPKLVESDTSDNTIGYFIAEHESVRTLGLIWNPTLDIFSYTVNFIEQTEVTKRFVLSAIAKIFDPLGLINPVIVIAKLLLQKVWQRKELGWDDCLNEELLTRWKIFYQGLTELNGIRIPRCVLDSRPLGNEIQLHGFSDASESALGACIYIRSFNTIDGTTVRLLCAKSKVAPLKKITLPRLELNAALLLARLFDKVKRHFKLAVSRVVLWTDSTIVLHWLAAEPVNWNTYVANRTAEIQRVTGACQWRHISSSDNPADLVSRGCYPSNLRNNKLWWNGPNFLTYDEACWPTEQITFCTETPEKRTKLAVLLTTNCEFIFARFSTFNKLLRTVAYMLRFVKRVRYKTQSIERDLTLGELNDARLLLIRLSQYQHFANEIECLRSKRPLPNNSKLLSLNIFLDENGLIRVGGRIKHPLFKFDKKHPVLLHHKHILTKLLIEHEHKLLLHAGQQAVLASLRNKYWPIHGKSTVRNVLHKCVICFKCKPFNRDQLMGDLPADRLVPTRPFAKVGVDYAGPIIMKDGTLHSRKTVKGYLCVFVCFLTKAVHLELAGDLTTDTFLNCLKRFVSRRGLCSHVFSDNGLNFVGANNAIKSVINNFKNDSKFKGYLADNQINWAFNCAYTPHQGGLWEAAVKSAKYHLLRIIGNSHLTYEHLNTLLCQIEAVLNSRPLTPLSNDPEDLCPLTPSHFLIGDVLTAVPQLDVTDVPENKLKSYLRLQQMIQHFWRRWSVEYLGCLQQRTKWKTASPNLEIGDLVIIREADSTPLHWKTGRVAALHPGEDGVVRVVSLKTVNGLIKRGVKKLYKLPIETTVIM